MCHWLKGQRHTESKLEMSNQFWIRNGRQVKMCILSRYILLLKILFLSLSLEISHRSSFSPGFWVNSMLLGVFSHPFLLTFLSLKLLDIYFIMSYYILHILNIDNLNMQSNLCRLIYHTPYSRLHIRISPFTNHKSK